MRIRNIVVGLFAPGALVAVLLFMCFLAEGVEGLRVFVNVEAAFVVLAGVVLSSWVAYPAGSMATAVGRALAGGEGVTDAERAESRAVLEFMASRAIAFGWIGTVFGLILLLTGVEDYARVPMRIGLSLDALLFGVLLAELILRPFACRLAVARARALSGARPSN